MESYMLIFVFVDDDYNDDDDDFLCGCDGS